MAEVPQTPMERTPIQRATVQMELLQREAKDYTRHEYMVKQGAKIKSWKRRYFSLSPDKMTIAYYKSAADCLEKKKPLGVISLEDGRARRVDYDTQREHMFEVYYPNNPKRRVFKITCVSAHAADSWVETVNNVIDKVSKGDPNLTDLIFDVNMDNPYRSMYLEKTEGVIQRDDWR
eukprot:TRINITY_DN1679_c0_g1_i1.p1 TRINITY_DN1679_c0_g1~~TRINITY_DN1679_c0_g1_i1.p1  ORF type:complete len:176 (-),score=48.41 TRINITY_DN1679_c0_g1_i1:156-683(-)